MRRLTKAQTYEVLDRYGDVVSDKRGTRFYRLHTDLPAFKKILKDREDRWFFHVRCIANLIIPAGTLIHVGTQGNFVKCRAERAIVHSIFTKDDHKIVGIGKSSADWGFKYVPGETVTPVAPFSQSHVVCSTGIHFFVDVNAALEYM